MLLPPPHYEHLLRNCPPPPRRLVIRGSLPRQLNKNATGTLIVNSKAVGNRPASSLTKTKPVVVAYQMKIPPPRHPADLHNLLPSGPRRLLQRTKGTRGPISLRWTNNAPSRKSLLQETLENYWSFNRPGRSSPEGHVEEEWKCPGNDELLCLEGEIPCNDNNESKIGKLYSLRHEAATILLSEIPGHSLSSVWMKQLPFQVAVKFVQIVWQCWWRN